MKITLSKGEMLERFRLAGGFEHLRSDCAIEATDGVDINALIEEQLRRIYTELLLTGPRELTAPEEFGATMKDAAYLGTNTGLVELPADVVRVYEIKLESWETTADVKDAEEAEALKMRADNQYTAPTTRYPAAATGSDGRTIVVSPAGSPRTVSMARGVRDPGPDKYTLEEAGLSWIFERMKTDFML
ncbi:MAG: hypothetical protein K2L96_01715 [Muribaculaceae bacterium]|nr:hypothetical protein [Muribaculaceae bacterium]